jgi:hypothetical protein
LEGEINLVLYRVDLLPLPSSGSHSQAKLLTVVARLALDESHLKPIRTIGDGTLEAQ